VLFVEEPQTVAGAPQLQLSEPHPNVVRAVPCLPSVPALAVDAQNELIRGLLEPALEQHPLLQDRFHTFVQWFYSPMPARAMLGWRGAQAVVYDCMDELANFRFAPPDIAQREQELFAHADLVFTGGRGLYEAKSRQHGNVHFFGCGVDARHFGTARDEKLAAATELTGLPRPCLGYFVLIDLRLDYELIDALARAFAQGSIAMVGPLAKVERSQLPGQPNIAWLGQRRYEDLPAIVKAFDVCLMPFAINDATRYINPTKTLEYMAAGKPVVSTAVPDVVSNFADTVAVGHSHPEFIAEVERALKLPQGARIAAGMARAQAASWEAIVAAMLGHIEHALAKAR